MKELSKSESENLEWLCSVVLDRTGKYTEEFKQCAHRNIQKFESRV
jgi:hypothetical protein